MISAKLYIQILVRVLLIVALSLLAGWSYFTQQWFFLSLFILAAIVLATINLIYFLNSVNRRLFYFFDAIRNEDSTLSFPDKSGDKLTQQLNNSLNKVNKQIQQIKIANQMQEQYFQAILEHAATGIFTLNANRFVLHSNASVRKLFSLEVFTHLNQLERVDQRLFHTLQTIRPSEQRLVTLNHERGSTQLLIKASSFVSGKEELILLSVQDIKNELDEKELDSWLRLIRVLMHEIMNSITPITSLSESLAGYFYSEEGVKTPGQINEKIIQTTIRGLDVIREQGKGLIAFVESYRKLTRLPKPDKKTIVVKNLLENIRMLAGSFEQGAEISLSYQLQNEQMELFADEKLISQVLINLVKNAFQSNEHNPKSQVKIMAGIEENNRPVICVSDNGPGIPPELIDEIFVPFFTTRENGSGIGLSLSRQIMRLHGGSLKVKSVPNIETSFYLTF